MSEIKLAKKIKQIIAPGCKFKIIEEFDGLIIEIFPVEESEKGGACVPIFDVWGNLIRCKGIDCNQCHMCTIEYPDGGVEYYCKCGNCPPKPPL